MSDFTRQREAVQCPWHLHIREQQNDGGVSRLKKLVCGIAVISFQHLKSSLFEDIDRVHADHEIVVYHKRVKARLGHYY